MMKSEAGFDVEILVCHICLTAAGAAQPHIISPEDCVVINDFAGGQGGARC